MLKNLILGLIQMAMLILTGKYRYQSKTKDLFKKTTVIVIELNFTFYELEPQVI